MNNQKKIKKGEQIRAWPENITIHHTASLNVKQTT